jgi:23S rRNA (guanine2445-N2)-methyltransferase
MELFATAAKGTEGALRDELRELGFRRVRATRGGVGFPGDLHAAMRACLHSRIAVRVLWSVGHFAATDGQALYDGIRSFDWTPHLDPRSTLAVKASCRSSKLTHSQFIAQRTKDAIVDQLRDRQGTRPDVSRDDPDVLVVVRIAKDQVDVYLDVGGGSLHKRGWRTRIGTAPIKETLAAAILRLGGWDRERPLCDPMCGAGTIAIEAAAWAANLAPGLGRKELGVERWKSFDAGARQALAELREEARAARRRHRLPPVLAYDVDPKMVEATRANARAAGLHLEVEQADVRELTALEPPGFVIANPPYDERLPVSRELHRELGAMVRRLPGHTIALLTMGRDLERAIGRPPDKWWLVHNGPLECRLLRYDV